LNIRNNINQALKLKFDKCIDLLDREYKSLNFTIDVYQDRERLEYERANKPDLKEEEYEQILNGEQTVGGLTVTKKRQIKIFLFHYGDLTDVEEVLHLIGNVYHEIRHAYQITKNLYINDEEFSKLDGNLEYYFGQEAEKDAYKFQLEQMQKNANEVLSIFGINKWVQSYTLKDEIMKYFNA
jgi:hypothetical protein